MSPAHSPDLAKTVKRLLVDPYRVCSGLGLDEKVVRQRKGLLIRCPWHDERTPSCSVRFADDGGIAVHCFGCGAGGDVLSLIAVANGWDTRGDFPRVLRFAAELAGVPWDRSSAGRSSPARPPRAQPEPSYPPTKEVSGLWAACRPVGDEPKVTAWLGSRALNAGMVEDFDLARALPSGVGLPHWACHQKRKWAESGHWLIFPMFDRLGVMRSLRARRVVGEDGPKDLSPAGFSTSGIVMADQRGRKLLETGRRSGILPGGVPSRIVVAEGQPDYLTWATRFSDADETAPAILGVVSGAWTGGIADRVPDGSRVVIRTHQDEAGEKYARVIYVSLRGRCKILRGGLGAAS